MKRFAYMPIGALLAALCILAAGCARDFRSETIVIPDTDSDQAEDRTGVPFDVKKIFRLPTAEEQEAETSLFAWDGSDTVVRLFRDKEGPQQLKRYAVPFSDSGKSLDLRLGSIYLNGFLPDGRSAYGVEEAKDGFKLATVSLATGQKNVLSSNAATLVREGLNSLTWSNNGRYASYLNEDRDGTRICVYDATANESETCYDYPMDSGDSGVFVKLSDDGRSGLAVKERNGIASLELGEWSQGALASQYEHPIANGIPPDWIDNDRIAFVGTDGTLFSYDRRNGQIAVLAEKVGLFRLSPDRQYIAYATDDATIDAAKLQGNNLLNPTTVYQGILPAQMAWSPDNGRLFVQGRKPYGGTEPQPAPLESVRDVPFFVIEFQ